MSSFTIRSLLYCICLISSFARNNRFIVAATKEVTNKITYRLNADIGVSLATTVTIPITNAGINERTINKGIYLNDTLMAVIYILVMSDLVIIVDTPRFFIFFFVSAVI